MTENWKITLKRDRISCPHWVIKGWCNRPGSTKCTFEDCPIRVKTCDWQKTELFSKTGQVVTGCGRNKCNLPFFDFEFCPFCGKRIGEVL